MVDELLLRVKLNTMLLCMMKIFFHEQNIIA